MDKEPHTSNWSVLILCTGYRNETLRSVVKTVVEKLGFDVHVYDFPGYLVDPTIHSHAACVKAIPSHDIVLAFADETEGGEFQIQQAPPAMLEDLRDRQIIPKEGSTDPLPTIFQVEVMTARSLGKPTIVFIENEVKSWIDQTLKLLKEGDLKVTARSESVPNLNDLVQESKWDDIARYYDVPTGRIKSFRQIAFLENLRKQEPNFISYYSPKDQQSFEDEIKSRLSGVAETYIRQHVEFVKNEIQKKRNPIGTESLQDLINQRLIIASPFEALSGDINSPLFSTDNQKGQIANSLIEEKDVLLLGNPGLGKTTASLFTFRDLASDAGSDLEGYAPLYASWRMLPELDVDHTERITSVGDFIRLLIGSVRSRPPWPSALHLLDKKWILVLDGLDESPLDHTSAAAIIRVIANGATLFVTCRRYDYDRYLQSVKHNFNKVIELLPWKDEDIKEYLAALKASGKLRAHAFISDCLDQKERLEFITLPLWLSMLTFLTERQNSGNSSIDLNPSDSYELLRLCADAVAEDELNRQGVTDKSTDDLRDLWGTCARELQKAYRAKKTLRVPDLETVLRIHEGTPLGKAVFAPFDTLGDQVYGFFHAVFQEYWLAEYLVDRLIDDDTDAKERSDCFSYQRSLVTNQFIRRRIGSRESIPDISKRLQEAVRSAGEVSERALFAKNQLVYLLGRIDESPANKNFLGSIWNSSEESLFVKHSAAFGAIMLGDSKIENEYYNLLSTSELDDQMNRGYHLYYYKDIDAQESAMPIMDAGENDAERTLRRLFTRLARDSTRYLNLRRIEMFTVRRFLETNRQVPDDISNAKGIITKAVADAKSHALSAEYVEGVDKEAELILALLPD